MSKSLAQSFASGTGRKTKWQGNTVYSVFQIPVKAGDTIELNRIGESIERAQALKLAADRDELTGMLIDKTDDGYTIRCSDGLGDPTFVDLTVNVAVRSSE